MLDVNKVHLIGPHQKNDLPSRFFSYQVAQIALPGGYPYSHSLHLLGNQNIQHTNSLIFKVIN